MFLPVFNKKVNTFAVLFFNPVVLHADIGEWINYRDNSAFTDDESGVSIIIECGSGHKALLHTLIHEASHVYDYFHSIKQADNEEKYPAHGLEISFYGLGETTGKENALTMYSILKNSPFSSLYGSASWQEDFAEAFTWYYLQKQFGINYITRLYENDVLLLEYDPGENELARERYYIFEEILK